MKRKVFILFSPVYMLVVVGFLVYLNQEPKAPPLPKMGPLAPQPIYEKVIHPPRVKFTNITKEAGIHYLHESGETGEYYFPEILGPGCAFLDYDNDGDQDLFIVNSGKWPHLVPDKSVPTVTHSLYRNDGHGKFVDVGKEMGLSSRKYGQGCCYGDIDNDGFVDIYVSCVGANALFYNQQGKGFVDIAEQAGVDCGEWSVPVCMLDYDRDGLVDIFVGNFVKWNLKIHAETEKLKDKIVERARGRKYSLADIHAYGLPHIYDGNFCRLYKNLGNLKFKDVSREANILRTDRGERPMSKSLGVGTFDYNDDGWPDIAVANDTTPDYLFRNNGDGTFTDVAFEVGLATSINGESRSGMGVACADFRNDGSLAVAISNFSGEMVGFYVARGDRSVFTDVASAEGLATASGPGVMWGMFFFDFDLDGRVDLFLSNGHTQPSEAKLSGVPYKQSPVLFWNTGTIPAFFTIPPSLVGPDFLDPATGRGAVYGDIDGDGDLDVATVENKGKARLFRNEMPAGAHFLRLKLVGTKSNRSALGARVMLRTGKTWQRREVVSGGSYASQMELPVTFGLGKYDHADEIQILWPSGLKQALKGIKAGQKLTVTEGVDQPATKHKPEAR